MPDRTIKMNDMRALRKFTTTSIRISLKDAGQTYHEIFVCAVA